jgi:phosphoglucosamine mutase
VREGGRPLRELAAAVVKCPQVLVNVPVRAQPDLADVPAVAGALARWERTLGGRARILVRYSGTEPVARVMVEGDDAMTIGEAARGIAEAIRQAIGGAA